MEQMTTYKLDETAQANIVRRARAMSIKVGGK